MPSDMPNVQEEGFRTGLFGFDKSDVLTCLNSLANEAQQHELTYQEQIHKLEAQLEKYKKEQTNARICVEKLQQELKEAEARATAAEKAAGDTTRLKAAAEDRTNTFRAQCSERDKAIAMLTEENERLKKQVDALIEHQNQEKAEREAERAVAQQQAAEAAQALQAARAAQAAAEKAAAEKPVYPAPAPAAPARPAYTPLSAYTEEARIQARKTLEDARLYAESAQAAMEQEAAEQKARMAENARNVAAGVLVLRDRLARVDERLDAASLDLDHATAAIYRALDETMDDINALESQMKEIGSAAAPQPQAGPANAVPPEPPPPPSASPYSMPSGIYRPATQAAPAAKSTPVLPGPEPAPAKPASPLRPKASAFRPVVHAKRLRSSAPGKYPVTQSLLDALDRMDDE